MKPYLTFATNPKTFNSDGLCYHHYWGPRSHLQLITIQGTIQLEGLALVVPLMIC